MNKDKQQGFYFQITDIWKRFCEEHNLLFNLTCDEYSLLLGSELEALDKKIEEKEATIKRINGLEKIRTELIANINKELSDEKKIKNVSELITHFNEYDSEKEQKHLFRFNSLLIDIIEKIQGQNKRNQLFINKAIRSLQSIREDAVGQKSFDTYDARGASKMIKANV
jgi:flagellar biosynthesis/type III secretory pathway chaperone